MAELIRFMQSLSGFVHMAGADKCSISAAEKALGVSFADDYKAYVSQFGAASFEGHEFTGICRAKRLNVADVTLNERQQNSNIPSDWYVVEQTNIDGIVIWQNKSGQIFQSAPMHRGKKIADSLLEYISL